MTEEGVTMTEGAALAAALAARGVDTVFSIPGTRHEQGPPTSAPATHARPEG
ncbi:MAG: hypothetical protein L0H96_17085 [Humibacillus sp.]|nr:hypothetical protein [Humibacillus sp.]